MPGIKTTKLGLQSLYCDHWAFLKLKHIYTVLDKVFSTIKGTCYADCFCNLVYTLTDNIRGDNTEVFLILHVHKSQPHHTCHLTYIQKEITSLHFWQSQWRIVLFGCCFFERYQDVLKRYLSGFFVSNMGGSKSVVCKVYPSSQWTNQGRFFDYRIKFEQKTSFVVSSQLLKPLTSYSPIVYSMPSVILFLLEIKRE